MKHGSKYMGFLLLHEDTIFFPDIGCIFGRVVSVNYKNLDYAFAMIYTDCLFDISCKIALEIDDSVSPVFVLEYRSPI